MTMLNTKDALALSYILKQRIEGMKEQLERETETTDGEDINDLIHYEVILSKLHKMTTE